MSNLPATLSTLNQEIGALTDQLAPADEALIARAIDTLDRGGMNAPAGIAPENLLSEYSIALDGVPRYGLVTAITKLKRGEYETIKAGFMPLPAELAAIARLEAKSLREDRIRKQETLNALAERVHRQVQASSSPVLRDLRIVQRERSAELASQGYVLIAEGVTHDGFASLAKSRSIPAGSRHLWALDEVWAPAAVAGQVDARMVDERTTAAAVASETISPERAATLEKMLALPDARNVTPEQMAYRRKCGAEIASVNADTDERREVAPDGEEDGQNSRRSAGRRRAERFFHT